MPATSLKIDVTKLPARAATALRARAHRIGMSPERCMVELIVEDDRLNVLASSRTFAELAKPFRKALAGKSNAELNALAKPHKRAVSE